MPDVLLSFFVCFTGTLADASVGGGKGLSEVLRVALIGGNGDARLEEEENSKRSDCCLAA